MALNELTIVVYIYAVPRSLCKDTKGVMEEIRVKQYRIWTYLIFCLFH